MIGTTLDKYEVLQKVGEGGMATVYRGRHATLNRDVAIKVLHPHLSSSARNRKRFAREARAIEKLHHENILEIFDYSGIEAHDCYIITEFVKGETLTDLLRDQGRLPSEVVAMIAHALTEALDYAHWSGILHRDLKPDNVMIRSDGTIKLMDFGIARFLNESQVTMTGALVGSPAFMSPEQAREDTLDQRSDLFALGTMMFYLVTGHLPFSGSNPSLILKNVIEGNRPHVAELTPAMSPTLADIIEQLMATHPEDRFPNAGAVGEALVASLAEVDLDPASPAWGLSAWFTDREGYTQRLDDHLAERLVANGRRLIAAGDHLAALRLFNRLLSTDENNEEVLELVQSLHGEPAGDSPSRAKWLGVAALAALALVATALGFAAAFGPSKEPAVVAFGEPLPPVAELESEPSTKAPRSVSAAEDLIEPPPPPPVERPRPVVVPVAGTEPEEEEPPAEVPEAQVGTLKVNSGALPATVYLRGTRLGDTRQSFQVPVGTHEIEIRSPFVVTAKQTVTVSPGEEVAVSVELKPRPATVRFDADSHSASCLVILDGKPMGTVGTLARALQVDRPLEPHTVGLDCGSDGKREHRWQGIPPLANFPP